MIKIERKIAIRILLIMSLFFMIELLLNFPLQNNGVLLDCIENSLILGLIYVVFLYTKTIQSGLLWCVSTFSVVFVSIISLVIGYPGIIFLAHLVMIAISIFLATTQSLKPKTK
ncbi:MAG: hypothetical protein N2749_03225 [Clostridia bacterium]|nr:hypothetical protein [Clostridia bacterium]